MTSNRFISFEGPEGGGKSTQVRLLTDALALEGHHVVSTREPGGSGLLGATIRKLLLDPEMMSPPPGRIAELMLYAADRAEHVERVIAPALLSGAIVICDRYIDSTIAYQGFGRSCNRDVIDTLNRIVTNGITPSLTVVLDVPTEVGLARAKSAKGGHDRMEQEDQHFHARVRDGFLSLVENSDRLPFGRRHYLVNAERSVDVVAKEVRELVRTHIGI